MCLRALSWWLVTECYHKHLNAYSYPEVSLIEEDDKCKEWD